MIARTTLFGRVCEVAGETYDYFLEVLPPRWMGMGNGGFAFGDFGGEKGVAILRGERLHHRFVRRVGLNERPARLFVTAGAAGNLAHKLERALAGAEVTAL